MDFPAPWRGHRFKIPIQFVDHRLDAVVLIHQAILLGLQFGDDFVMGLGRFANLVLFRDRRLFEPVSCRSWTRFSVSAMLTEPPPAAAPAPAAGVAPHR